MTNPVNIVIICDPGKDLDDENTLILARHLCDIDLVDVVGVVAVLAPSDMRARLAKGTLNELQLQVPVGIGSDCTVADTGESVEEFAGVTYLADTASLETGSELLHRILREAEQSSLVWLLISGLTDIAAILRTHEELFQEKTQQIVIMGGVQTQDNAIQLDHNGFMVPDSAANNSFDKNSTEFVYRRIQDLQIPMTVLMREAAYAAQVPRSHYDRLADTGHPVGLKLKNT